MQLFARFFRPSGALFGTSAVGDKARRASDRPWTGRAHRSTGRCSAVTVLKRPMPTGSVASPNGWRPACRGMRRLGARLPSCAIRSSDRSNALRVTADRTALSKERATAHPDRRGGHPGKAGRQRDHPPARRAGRTARPRGFGQCRHERPPGQPASGLSQVLPVYVRTTGETDDICVRFSPPLLREAEIMPEAGLRTLRRTAECSGRGHRAGRTRRSPLSF